MLVVVFVNEYNGRRLVVILELVKRAMSFLGLDETIL
jgi:hypothetical protein